MAQSHPLCDLARRATVARVPSLEHRSAHAPNGKMQRMPGTARQSRPQAPGTVLETPCTSRRARATVHEPPCTRHRAPDAVRDLSRFSHRSREPGVYRWPT